MKSTQISQRRWIIYFHDLNELSIYCYSFLNVAYVTLKTFETLKLCPTLASIHLISPLLTYPCMKPNYLIFCEYLRNLRHMFTKSRE